MSDEGDGDISRADDQEGQGNRKGLLRRIVKRVLRTSDTVRSKAGDRIRGLGHDSYVEDTDDSAADEASYEAAAEDLSELDASSELPTTTPAPSVPAEAAASFRLRRSGSAVGGGSRSAKGAQPRAPSEAVEPPTWSALDVSIQPLQAFAASIQNQVEALEGQLGRRLSDAEVGFSRDRAALTRKLEEERLASREKLREAEEQLRRLQVVWSEKERAEETVRRMGREKDAASAQFEASASKLREEAEVLRDRLDVERRNLAALRSDSLAARKAQEREMAEAKQRLTGLLQELEREKQASVRAQEKLTAEATRREQEQARALRASTDAAANADGEWQRAEAARVEAEARVLSTEAALASANADMAAATSRWQAELATAKARAEMAEADAAAAKSASGMDALQNELARTSSELKEQAKRTAAVEAAKERAEAEAARRSRGLQELMEKNRARYERTTTALRAEIKELSLLKSVAAGFEDMRVKLGIAQTREAELDRQVIDLTNKVQELDKRLAEGEEKAAAEARLMEAKEQALREVEAKLRAASDRSESLEKEAERLPAMQASLDKLSSELDAERRRGDKLQALQDEAAAKAELVKDRMFDLERAAELSEWNERNLAKENQGLQELMGRNRMRYEKEMAKLAEASRDLAQKNAALEELEAAMQRERDNSRRLGEEVSDLQERSAAMATELIHARNKLAGEATNRKRAESALREMSEVNYVKRQQTQNELAELDRLRATVEGLESARREDVLKWSEERSGLATRLDEAVRSSDAFSTRITELEGIVEGLRQESRIAKQEADELRGQLERAEASAVTAGSQQERLASELEEARAEASEARQERTKLQDRVAELMAALQQATASATSGTPPANPLATGDASMTSTPPYIRSTTLDSSVSEDEGDVIEAAKEDETGTKATGIGEGLPGTGRPRPRMGKKPRRALLRPWQVGGMTKADTEKLAQQIRENDETVAAIDEFLERAQDVAVGGPSPAEPVSSPPPGNADGEDAEGTRGGPTGSRSRSWAPFSRWSK